MSAARGWCSLVLHTHLPYVHHPEYDDFLEEDWLFEAICETYLPLIDALRRLLDDGVPVRLAMSVTPPLASMLRTESLIAKFDRFLSRRLALARILAEAADRDPLWSATAAHYVATYEAQTRLWNAIDRDLVGAFADLQARGAIEIIASAATHAFLPLLATESAVRAQIDLGVALHHDLFGRAPRGFWLPECAYRPGLERPLRAAGISWVVLDHHGVTCADPRPRSRHLRPVTLPEGLAAFGRDPECSEQVWSSVIGYPGDPAYRELYRDAGYDEPYAVVRPFLKPDGIRRNVGLKFHRVTGKVELHEKALYDHAAALERADVHAGNFLYNRSEQIKARADELGEKVVITAPFDTELFGHWWYEGPVFLERLFRRAAAVGDDLPFAFASPSDVLDAPGSRPAVYAHHSSWGRNGFSEVWLNEANAWMWPHLHELERRMAARADEHRDLGEGDPKRRLLDQMGRELLLAQSSDWPFIVTMQTSMHYAERRFRDHVHRFLALEKALETGSWDAADLARVEAHDAVVPGAGYTAWRR